MPVEGQRLCTLAHMHIVLTVFTNAFPFVRWWPIAYQDLGPTFRIDHLDPGLSSHGEASKNCKRPILAAHSSLSP